MNPHEPDLEALLQTARRSLDLSVTFATSFHSQVQEIIAIDSDGPTPVGVGSQIPLVDTFCRAILAGELPTVIEDVQGHPVASGMAGAAIPGLRSFLSVPITFQDGTVYGTLCACSFDQDPPLHPRDEALMALLATTAALLLEPQVTERRRNEAARERHRALLDSGALRMVVQPIVDLRDNTQTGWEALARFPSPWPTSPDLVFLEAHRLGVGADLEVQAVTSAAEQLDRLEGYLSVNASAAVVLTPQFQEAVSALPLHRLLLEISEHDPVEDYDALHGVLRDLRTDGLRLAVDDVGSGYSSLRHIVALFPDVIKLDRSIVTGLGTDTVRRTLVSAMLDFASGCGADLVAEGVETSQDLHTLANLGVRYGQGFHLGRPGAPSDLRQPYPEA